MSTALRHIESQWNSTVIPSILEQYKDSEKWQALLKSVIDGFQIGEDAVDEFTRLLDFKSAMPTGGHLDWIAGLININRMPGEADTSLFTRFIMILGKKDAGTPNAVIRSAAILSGDTAPQYMDEADCTFFVYDGPVYEHHEPQGEEPYDTLIKEPGVKQLTHAQVKKLAPAGVLGLPGAALNVADDNEDTLLLVLDYEDEWGGKLLICVADDSTVENELVLSDNFGNVIMASQGAPLSVTIKGGVSVPTIPATVGGTTYDTVRIKDLPDVNAGFMVRDSEESGTGKAHTMTESELDTLWDDTPAEEEDDG